MRNKLIHAAIERFGKRGFDAVGTREIAAAVGTPMSSITYHFGGKEGLYLAAAEHIFDYLRDHVAPQEEDMPSADASDAERLDAICNSLRRVGAFMLGEDSAHFALFIGREQQDPTPAVLDMMRERIIPMMFGLSAQVRFLRPQLSEDEAKAVAVYIFGMAITLRHARASLELLLEQQPLNDATKAMLLDQLEQSARAVLAGGVQ